jgi:hypothetical protein
MTSNMTFCISYQNPKKSPLPWWEGMKGRGSYKGSPPPQPSPIKGGGERDFFLWVADDILLRPQYFIISIEFFASLFYEISGRVEKSLINPCLPAGRDYKAITPIPESEKYFLRAPLL